MAHIPFIDELALISAIAAVLAVILARFRLPTVAGLLLAGALIGPHALGAVKNVAAIEILAEVGVVLLLFSIGLEFSLERLRHIFGQVAIGGLLQLGLTFGATFGVAVAVGLSTEVATLLGFMFGLSSTAIVLRGLAERRELDAPHGRFIVGTLLIQDLAVVPMVLIVPLLAPSAPEQSGEIGLALLKAVAVVVGTLLFARKIVPSILAWIDSSKSRDVFLLAVLAICIGTAFLTSLAGLSLALGAFLGGMVVADSPYGHRALADILPLRDLFVSIFFVSLGMLFQPEVVMAEPLLTLALVAAFMLGKGFLATLAAMAMRFPARVAWLAGVGLAQFGEFGFVLAKLGESSNLIDSATLSPVLAAGIISMFFTPLLVRLAPHITAGERLLAPLEKLIGVKAIDVADDERSSAQKDHVVVIGYGLAAQILIATLKARGVTYLVLELDPERVRKAAGRGEPVFYADATSDEALGHAHIDTARALVILISDSHAAHRIVELARERAPHVPTWVRTRYVHEGEALTYHPKPSFKRRDASPQAAAHELVFIAEEVEGGAVVADRLLRALGVPDAEAREEVEVATTAVLASR
jgi:CPA2 family monovalent cation:H+ antiporter-2